MINGQFEADIARKYLDAIDCVVVANVAAAEAKSPLVAAIKEAGGSLTVDGRTFRLNDKDEIEAVVVPKPTVPNLQCPPVPPNSRILKENIHPTTGERAIWAILPEYEDGAVFGGIYACMGYQSDDDERCTFALLARLICPAVAREWEVLAAGCADGLHQGDAHAASENQARWLVFMQDLEPYAKAVLEYAKANGKCRDIP